MLQQAKPLAKNFVSISGHDEFDARALAIEFEGETIFVQKLLEARREHDLVFKISRIITQLNDGFAFGEETAAEWTKYLIALVHGHGVNLINPYSDLANYEIRAFSERMERFDGFDFIEALEDMPSVALQETPAEHLQLMSKTLYITALGGTDSSFYNGLSRDEMQDFSQAFYGPEVLASFQKYHVADLIPRGFAAKTSARGNQITNAESTILQAYHAGIRFVAVIGNAKTRNAIADYLDRRLGKLRDLHILVTAQPLLPIIKACPRTNKITVSAENGGYQGGHGHGFAHCLQDPQVRQIIEKQRLEFFIFGNGDNTAMLNWGTAPYVATLTRMQKLRQRPGFENLGFAFFLVWEYLRKGGFAFLLRHKKTGKQIAQLFEAELAEKSGADIQSLEFSRGGYNTNVAAGIIAPALSRFGNLPMALKKKNYGEYTQFLFEASLGTAMTTHQNEDGSSVFDANAAVYVLGPRLAKYQHWNHISIRKRDDLFAYFTSLYKIKTLKSPFGEIPLIATERTATQSYPRLAGNFVNPEVLNTKRFFEVFKDANMEVDEFFGALKIDLLAETGKARGIIKFEGTIKLTGEGELHIAVPAGQAWVIRDKVFSTIGSYTVSRDQAEAE